MAKKIVIFLAIIAIANASILSKIVKDIPSKIGNSGKKLTQAGFCATCRTLMKGIIDYRKNGASRTSFRNFLLTVCPSLILDAEVCKGHIDLRLDSIIYIIDNTPKLTAARACGIIFQMENCRDRKENRWTVNIAPSEARQKQSARRVQTNTKPLKILHLTDIHYDPEYVVKSNADCGLSICCQSNKKNRITGKFVEAGYWSDYHSCDMPWHTITSLMNHLKTYGENYFDLVYYTGDIMSHKTWATSKQGNEEAISQLYQLFGNTFKNITVFPALGNHEPSPSFFFTPDDVTDSQVNTRWVLETVANQWSKWLPNYTERTIKPGGFYTVLVRPGFRIISLNNNVCYTRNFWLLYEDQDPYGQLQWLADTLKQAEQNGELVHFISHIPPGDKECLQQWTVQFRKIVERFAHIIAGQFSGHTHLDELRLFYDQNNQVNNVVYIGGSFTTWPRYNPSYRVYTVDSNTLQVLDYDQYMYNVTLANQNNATAPEWIKYYSFKEAYGLENLQYDDLTQFMTRFTSDKSLQQQYFRFQSRGSDALLSKTKCNSRCLSSLVCQMKAVEARESVACGSTPK